ncbi:MAG: LacI family DNA-binding transcriptional regulator [Verrucomicrobia bacterium]|nr:LacI family DNA-binding transcriptional regulator [Verrucomicrobiota bacterium]
MAPPRGPTRSVSLQQFADAAGVSLACASYALRRSHKIPAATRDRVLAAASLSAPRACCCGPRGRP